MKTLSAQAFASIFIISRIFSLSLYVPKTGENAAVTAVCVILMTAAKGVLLLPIFAAHESRLPCSKGCALLRAVFTAAAAAVFLLIISDGFSTAVESVYPDRFTKLGIAAIIFLISAYIASMDMSGVSRAAAICTVAFIVIFGAVFIQMRSAALCDRINLYSKNSLREAAATFKNILALSLDYFLFFALLPYLKGSPKKAAGIYLCTDLLLSLIFFMQCAAVMGEFYSRSGFCFYTLSYCTHGSIIDRADGIFLAIASACAFICSAALLTVIKDSLKLLTKAGSEPKIFGMLALTLTAAALGLYNAKLRISEQAFFCTSVIWAGVLLLALGGRILRTKKAGRLRQNEEADGL